MYENHSVTVISNGQKRNGAGKIETKNENWKRPNCLNRNEKRKTRSDQIDSKKKRPN
jgi:hypothetical protein